MGLASASMKKGMAGKSASLARRQMLSLHAKKHQPAVKTSIVSGDTPCVVVPSLYDSPAPQIIMPAPVMSAARQRRLEQSQRGRGSAAPCRPCGRVKPSGQKTVASAAQSYAAPAAYAATPAPSVAATPAASHDCGCGTGTSAPSAIIEYARQPIQPASQSAARQRRLEQSLKGRGNAPPCRPCGRVRPQPEKVETGTTLSGSTVTGNQVERTTQVTGNEAGSCRNITGTEYIGAEQYAEFCGTQPEPTPAKVGASSTGRGRRVTGTEVGRSAKVTGDESGTCKRVTGTEYLSAEQSGEFCGTAPEPQAEKVVQGLTEKRNPVSGSDLARKVKVTGTEAGEAKPITGTTYADLTAPRAAEGEAPKKVEIRHTGAGSVVTGTEVGRSTKVTGDESGTCKRVTGTEYLSAEQSGEFCGTQSEPHPEKVVAGLTEKRNPVSGTDLARKIKVTGTEAGEAKPITGTTYADLTAPRAAEGDAPKKVETRHTGAGMPVSGTQVGRSAKVTGDESGSCKQVTGSDYISAEEFVSFCRSEPYQSPAKVGVSRTLHGQDVSGSQVGRSAKVTGDEYGACKPVTGSAYIGAEQYAKFCSSRVEAEAANRVRLGNSPALTGIQPGPDEKMTGNERGACQTVSGTPYMGDEQYAATCGRTPMAMHYRSRGPADSMTSAAITGNAMEASATSPSGKFSVASPASSAQSSEARRITGNAYGDGGRITGPLARATGLVSGTPEFRYREEAVAQAPVQAPAPAAEAAAERITGEGRERRITGDAWDRGNRVTGTEGHSATRRNPTLRGDPRGSGVNARVFREVETPAPGASRITGSSGNTSSGATITLSGGARG